MPCHIHGYTLMTFYRFEFSFEGDFFYWRIYRNLGICFYASGSRGVFSRDNCGVLCPRNYFYSLPTNYHFKIVSFRDSESLLVPFALAHMCPRWSHSKFQTSFYCWMHQREQYFSSLIWHYLDQTEENRFYFFRTYSKTFPYGQTPSNFQFSRFAKHLVSYWYIELCLFL